MVVASGGCCHSAAASICDLGNRRPWVTYRADPRFQSRAWPLGPNQARHKHGPRRQAQRCRRSDTCPRRTRSEHYATAPRRFTPSWRNGTSRVPRERSVRRIDCHRLQPCHTSTARAQRTERHVGLLNPAHTTASNAGPQSE